MRAMESVGPPAENGKIGSYVKQALEDEGTQLEYLHGGFGGIFPKVEEALEGKQSGSEVSLTLDNSSGLLPIDFTEVTITRTLFRTGESEYAINGVSCRLLDVQELLSDAGRSFDGVLMDCQMPVMDGFEATRRLRSQAGFADLPVIAMTASALVSDRDRALAVGMNDHIPKPLDVNQMYQVISRWVRVAQRARMGN